MATHHAVLRVREVQVPGSCCHASCCLGGSGLASRSAGARRHMALLNMLTVAHPRRAGLTPRATRTKPTCGGLLIKGRPGLPTSAADRRDRAPRVLVPPGSLSISRWLARLVRASYLVAWGFSPTLHVASHPGSPPLFTCPRVIQTTPTGESLDHVLALVGQCTIVHDVHPQTRLGVLQGD